MIKRNRTILQLLAGLYILLVLFGFTFAPSLAKKIATQKLSEALKRPVSIQEIKINPFELSATIKGFQIGESSGPKAFVTLKELYVNLELSSIVKRGVVIKELKIASPYAHIERTGDNAYNFTDLIEKDKTKPVEEKSAEPLKFSVNNIQITDGRVEIDDNPKQAHHVAQDINISLPFISNLKANVDTFVKPHFYATFNGSPIKIEGMAKPFVDTLDTSMAINFQGIDIPEYLKYSPVEPPVAVNSGKFSIDCQISFTQKKGEQPELSLTGLLSLRDLSTSLKSGAPLASIRLLNVQIASSNILQRTFRLSEILLSDATVNVERYKDGKINLMTIVPTQTLSKAKPESPAVKDKTDPPLILSVASFKIANAGVKYKDGSFSAPYETAINPINLTINDFSTEQNHTASYELSATKDEKETISAKGSLSVDPILSEGSFDVAGINLVKLTPIYKSFVGLVIDRGIFGVKGEYSFVKERTPSPATLSGVAIQLDGLRLKDPQEAKPFLSIDKFAILNTSAEPGLRTLLVGEVQTSGGALDITRLKDGTLSFMRLIPAMTNTPKAPKPDQEKPWLVDLGAMSVGQYAVNIKDMTPSAEPFTLSVKNIGLSLKHFSTDPKRSGNLSMSARIDKRGSFSADGAVSINPVRINLTTRIKDIGVWLVQPYIKDKVKIVIADGYLNASGRIKFNAENGTAEFSGDTRIANLMTLDTERYEDILGWKNLALNGIRASQNPNSIEIGSVELDGLKTTLAVSEDKSTNISRLFPKPPDTTEKQLSPAPVEPTEATKDAKPWNVKIGDVIFSNGNVYISDRSISPVYKADMSKLEGKITGISSIAKDPAKVQLNALWDGHAPITITGSLRPFKENMFADIKLKFSNMDLSTLTPYSGTFAGLVISKGKLFVETSTKIDGTELSSSNKLLIDQFEFGDTVQSEKTMNLPFKLAVALLKNRKGEISIDMPITGRTDDPEFSYGRIIIDIIINLVVKAATSPFSLIASAFSGGDEISNIMFNPGLDTIPDAETKKLDAMATALYDRPALNVDVKGYADRKVDEDAYRSYVFANKIKAAKYRELIDEGTRDISVESMTISPEERSKYLTLAYKAETFKKPRNFIGLTKSLPDNEMEKLIRDNIIIKDDDLRELSLKRARKVIAQLAASGKVEPARLFLVESGSFAPKTDDKLPPNRVEFTLK